jgi:hypothetical protein
MDTELTAALERALVRQLRGVWWQVNQSYFKEALTPPTIELVASRAHLGRWLLDTRTIEISRPLVLEQPWGSVTEVLKHEMAHQYAHEVLDAVDETSHGPAFRSVCGRLGIDARAAGVPGAPGDEASDRIVERIAKLLALAESSNQHEAEAAMAAAQKLMLKHNLEARTHEATRNYRHEHLGKPTGRVTESERILAMILGKFFFVEVIWVPVYRAAEGKRGSVLEVCGTDSNLAIATYVHGFLTATADRLWRDHKRRHAIDSNRDRRTYLAGVVTGFAERLARQSAGHREEGLVWVKDGDLGKYFRLRHPYVRHVRHSGTKRTEAYAHGREAGRQIVLRRAVEAAAVDRGRLLKR